MCVHSAVIVSMYPSPEICANESWSTKNRLSVLLLLHCQGVAIDLPAVGLPANAFFSLQVQSWRLRLPVGRAEKENSQFPGETQMSAAMLSQAVVLCFRLRMCKRSCRHACACHIIACLHPSRRSSPSARGVTPRASRRQVHESFCSFSWQHREHAKKINAFLCHWN